MTMLDLRLILVLCCSLQLSRLASSPFTNVCPPEFPHQFGNSKCYSINEEYLTFDEAQASCIAMVAKLAEPRKTYEESYVSNLPFRVRNNDSYWFGITDTVVPGVWTYASDNSPLISFWQFNDSNPPHGNYCITIKSSSWFTTYLSTPCEQKAKSVCQYESPIKVCGIREGGSLFPFNATYGAYFVQTPCEYILANIVCGDYDVRVYGTSAPGKNRTTFYAPLSARVVVQRAMTHKTLVSAEIAESTDGKNFWTLTAGAWSTEISVAFETPGQAAAINIGEVGQVGFSGRMYKDLEELYVLCKDLRSSAAFPESICGLSEEATSWTEGKSQIEYLMGAIFLQNAGQQLQCSDIARKAESCRRNKWAAIKVCSPFLMYELLNRCVEDDIIWFATCLDSYCDKNVDKCKELKTKVSGCGLLSYRRVNGVMKPLKAFLNKC